MAKKSRIRIRISQQRIEALHEICEEMLEEFVPQNDHQQLLREYLAELHYKLLEMMKRNQQMYTLIHTGPEALAFYQVWNMMDISGDKYASLVVDSMIKKMSRIAA